MFSENKQSTVSAKDDYDKSHYLPTQSIRSPQGLPALTENKGDVGMKSQDGKATERGPHAGS